MDSVESYGPLELNNDLITGVKCVSSVTAITCKRFCVCLLTNMDTKSAIAALNAVSGLAVKICF